MEDDHREATLMQEIYSAGLLVELLVTDELHAVGVPPQQFSFLGWVYALQPVTPGELAAETGMPPTTVRDHVRRLVTRGLVRKIANPADGRSYHLVLTQKGRRLADRGWPAVIAAYERVAPHLERPTGEHVAALRELRAALKAALAEQGTAGAELPHAGRPALTAP